jgi:hypothetical protein
MYEVEEMIDFAELDSLPEANDGRRRSFTKEEDEAILYAWPRKNKRALCRMLGISYNTVLERYRELTKVNE